MLGRSILILTLGCMFYTTSVEALWSCTANEECSELSGGLCRDGDCSCPLGQQPVLGGTLCVDLAPYHVSPCFEDYQCSRLTVAYECRRTNGSSEGTCACQPNHHYFLGRCWSSIDFGQPCSRSEECLSAAMRDPHSLKCDGTCQCADGFYERQRGECRRIGYAVGDGCVLDEDCQFEGGACDISSFACYNGNSGAKKPLTPTTRPVNSTVLSPPTRQYAAECGPTNSCAAPLECSTFGVCLCPIGYYSNGDGTLCYADLGSPSTPEQCIGFLSEVRDGVCTCPANFFFEENMRDCVRVTRIITESCVTDSNCATFGAAARCGEEQPPWDLRACECDPEQAVWDQGRQMCRLFAGIGDSCDVDSDCMAGELQIQCLRGEDGQGYCACPDGLVDVDGLCLTMGLALGDSCQADQECIETLNAVCEDGRCSCDRSGYREEDGFCAPIIGGNCQVNSDCVIQQTYCSNSSKGWTCQCYEGLVEFEDECWTAISDLETPCNVSAQCQYALGEASACADGLCACDAGHHYRDGGCWPVTGLFEMCSRTSQCYLRDLTERVVCRNRLCQCDFQFPYSEEQHTCLSSGAASIFASLLLIKLYLVYLLAI